jgi:hypothetical protein
MPSRITLSVAVGDYEIIRALKEGAVEVDGLDLVVLTGPRTAGQIEGMHYVRTNKEGSIRILRKHLQITDTAAVEGTCELFAKRLSRVPRTETEKSRTFSIHRRRPEEPGRIYRHEHH